MFTVEYLSFGKSKADKDHKRDIKKICLNTKLLIPTVKLDLGVLL